MLAFTQQLLNPVPARGAACAAGQTATAAAEKGGARALTSAGGTTLAHRPSMAATSVIGGHRRHGLHPGSYIPEMPPVEEQMGITMPITSRVPQRCAVGQS
eukprot:scaffold114060_cov20-Tisochrysis_lutea.AAC.1